MSAIQGFLMSMKKRSGLSELSIISWMSAVEGCPLSWVSVCPLQGGCPNFGRSAKRGSTVCKPSMGVTSHLDV